VGPHLPVMWVGLWLCDGSRPSVWVPMARMFCWMWAWAIISCCCRLLGCWSVWEPLITGGLKCLECQIWRKSRGNREQRDEREQRERDRENGGGNRAAGRVFYGGSSITYPLWFRGNVLAAFIICW